jgi:hypothetical protein
MHYPLIKCPSGAGWREPTSSDQLPIHWSESPTGYSSPGRPVIKYKLGYLLYWNQLEYYFF